MRLNPYEVYDRLVAAANSRYKRSNVDSLLAALVRADELNQRDVHAAINVLRAELAADDERIRQAEESKQAQRRVGAFAAIGAIAKLTTWPEPKPPVNEEDRWQIPAERKKQPRGGRHTGRRVRRTQRHSMAAAR